MPKKPTFNMHLRDNETRVTPYDRLIYTRGHEAWTLALHRVRGPGSEWTVSDPVSGMKVCTVTASFKGVPVSSGDLPLKHARAAALVDLDLTVDRVGLDRFSAVLAAAQNPKPVHPLKG